MSYVKRNEKENDTPAVNDNVNDDDDAATEKKTGYKNDTEIYTHTQTHSCVAQAETQITNCPKMTSQRCEQSERMSSVSIMIL